MNGNRQGALSHCSSLFPDWGQQSNAPHPFPELSSPWSQGVQRKFPWCSWSKLGEECTSINSHKRFSLITKIFQIDTCTDILLILCLFYALYFHECIISYWELLITSTSEWHIEPILNMQEINSTDPGGRFSFLLCEWKNTLFGRQIIFKVKFSEVTTVYTRDFQPFLKRYPFWVRLRGEGQPDTEWGRGGGGFKCNGSTAGWWLVDQPPHLTGWEVPMRPAEGSCCSPPPPNQPCSWEEAAAWMVALCLRLPTCNS